MEGKRMITRGRYHKLSLTVFAKCWKRRKSLQGSDPGSRKSISKDLSCAILCMITPKEQYYYYNFACPRYLRRSNWSRHHHHHQGYVCIFKAHLFQLLSTAKDAVGKMSGLWATWEALNKRLGQNDNNATHPQKRWDIIHDWRWLCCLQAIGQWE